MLVAGCGSSADGNAQPSGGAPATSIAADVPQGFDPCNDIPSSVLDSLELEMKIPADNDADGTE
ncbi:hypothetical protein C5E45_31485 [Nocardia nova]|uniref:DUF3558 domain-containing protein n=1 Tax=Nocardia nova TaxID=37330 RepID=A0A2S6AGB8_9NOCA|nr:DUF3558 domain-containing protein [Nocardia nova]PPJ19992.1 hypothetical protein C5E41_29820 [Nocardia nova]PPJ33822.1 hypothetical protein C5E45_31485 [Nocardia nova]